MSNEKQESTSASGVEDDLWHDGHSALSRNLRGWIGFRLALSKR